MFTGFVTTLFRLKRMEIISDMLNASSRRMNVVKVLAAQKVPKDRFLYIYIYIKCFWWCGERKLKSV